MAWKKRSSARWFLPPRGAGPRRAQTDLLSAWARRRRQVIARRASEGADGSPPHLRVEGRRRIEPRLRSPEPVRSGNTGRARGKIRIRAAAQRADEPWCQAVERSAATSRNSVSPRSSRRGCGRSGRQDRAGRREQSGDSLVGKVDIRKLETAQNALTPSYSGGLNRQSGIPEFVEMFRRRSRSASVADGDAGKQHIGTEISVRSLYRRHPGVPHESSRQSFKTNKIIEVFIDRIASSRCRIACASPEQKIYES